MLNLLVKVRDRLDQIGVPNEEKNTNERPTFTFRDNEQGYAKLYDPKVKKNESEENRYGQKIDLLDLTEGTFEQGRSMQINENPSVGCNPNRNKQHGFHFTADNCIGCHACEAACSEKNENPAHLAFRSVGYVEGGSYPDYKRMNISMACNHCDDPVCLKGCPTKAYTKHTEYGAVLQDPDTCFGCGYCTWVCPYNAPQLDPVKGQVSKCNMCVDRLEVGLKPACVSACLGNALNFGVIEDTPENREQTEASIPGFPDPSITQPNIRFQQIKTLPEEMTRTDVQPLKYHKQEDGSYRSVVNEKAGKERSWNLKRLSSRENPLVMFTLSTQAVIGAFMILLLGPSIFPEAFAFLDQSAMKYPLLGAMIFVQALGLFLSTLHLGKPLRFYRGFNNLRWSPLSREALGIAMFFAGLCGYTVLSAINEWLQLGILDLLISIAGGFAVISALIGLYFMHCIYRIKARPFWNHWQVLTSFFGSMFSVGGIVFAVFACIAYSLKDLSFAPLLSVLSGLVFIGLLVESIGLVAHARYLNTEQGEGAAAHYIQWTTFGNTYLARNVSLVLGLLISAVFFIWAPTGISAALIGIAAGLGMIIMLLVGRALFYILVVPTTMPGAFFWKNKGFEEHARDIGLAEMPQVGVVPDLH
ncbi:aspartate carbamoyltransferase [Oleiphilus sp. HI0068]|nr:aspartate carbamoyltransferase [Oleiphilus sp. HI0068]KZY83352.1 aspartate carbamoyltransferase [Oleiphilus sp. HI0069]KZZ33595.1 aspartate carbamoyltransferase [Oleiphilus sp. HI0085]